MLDIEQLRQFCLSIKGAEECMPFGNDALVMKVMGKMFALFWLEPCDRMALKCDPDYAVELRELYQGIEPAYHFNKKYWIQLSLESDVDEDMAHRLIMHSVDEVVKKMTRKQKEAYEAL